MKCFVVMGFGEKADVATGRTLDLDKTYRLIIKRAVLDAGLECIRADEVIHAGIIDKPMYELLLDADVVVADLSTSNANAIYELGVRHALRPHTTIVIAEKQFKFPFDIGHLLVRPYEHLGKGIDGEEADRMRSELTQAIKALVDKKETDSPVYTFLSGLQCPTKAELAIAVAVAAASAGSVAGSVAEAVTAAENAEGLLELFQEARADEDWRAAAKYLNKLLERRPKDPYLLQQLALATYKGKKPDPESALFEAHRILHQLDPEATTDAETLGLWGAVHKRLWDLKKDRRYLDESIRAYEKGFLLKNDHYNGINFAYTLNMRAAVSESRDALADTVLAERVRARVIPLCQRLLEHGITDDDGKPDRAETFWVQASLLEALVGSGQAEGAAALDATIRSTAPEGWMVKTMDEQIASLRGLLAAVQGAGQGATA